MGSPTKEIERRKLHPDQERAARAIAIAQEQEAEECICTGLAGDGLNGCKAKRHDPEGYHITSNGDTHRIDSAPPGETGNAKKLDVGKAPVVQGFNNYFPHAIVAVSYVSEYGDRKYSETPGTYKSGWKDVPNGQARYADADGRHRLKLQIEGNYDAESEIAHLAHKAWNAMAELETAIVKGGVEIRIGNQLDGLVPRLGTFKRVK